MQTDQLSHFPVMVNEVVSFLEPKKEKIYLDCTFGQGGYSKKILESAECKVCAIDRDSGSNKYAKILSQEFDARFIFSNTKFSDLHFFLHKKNIKTIDGMVLDLGVSNTQLNDPRRGFSFNYNGPLDMRMDNINTKLTAEIIINEYDEKELSDIFFYYGDEKNSRKIANSIVQFRRKKKIDSTKMLSDIIQKINKYKFKHPATRVFQALRIVINEELNELEEALKISLEILTKNARIVIVAFHSLEDMIIKNFFKKNGYKNLNDDKKNFFRIITKKPLTPSPEEIRINPRSKSAKLRVAEKI